jgi:hypothetical protein
VTQQLRIYTLKEGRLDDWVRLFTESVRPLRAANGFAIEAWAARDENEFVWLVSRDGTREEFEAADKAYYELPDHKPLHEQALNYLERGASRFLEPVGTGA